MQEELKEEKLVEEGDENDEANKYYEKFSEATWKRFTSQAEAILEALKEGQARQMLTIAVTECESITDPKNYFFRAIQNFELNIFLGKRFF